MSGQVVVLVTGNETAPLSDSRLWDGSLFGLAALGKFTSMSVGTSESCGPFTSFVVLATSVSDSMRNWGLFSVQVSSASAFDMSSPEIQFRLGSPSWSRSWAVKLTVSGGLVQVGS